MAEVYLVLAISAFCVVLLVLIARAVGEERRENKRIATDKQKPKFTPLVLPPSCSNKNYNNKKSCNNKNYKANNGTPYGELIESLKRQAPD